jgi:hypothetical protein
MVTIFEPFIFSNLACAVANEKLNNVITKSVIDFIILYKFLNFKYKYIKKNPELVGIYML